MRRHFERAARMLSLLATILWCGPPPAARAEEQSARDLVKQVIDALPQVPLIARLTLTTDSGAVRDLELDSKMIGGARASYLEVTAPPDLQGIRFLFLEKTQGPPEQYIKVAASPRSVKVAGEIRKQPFLGSTFYVADMVEPELDAFTYTFVGQATLNGRQCTLVQSVPKNPKAAVYGKSVMALDPKDSIVLRREFFDADGRLLKVWSVDKVEKIDGHWTLMDHKMTNVQEQTQSRLQVDSIRYNADLADSIFTPKYLVR